MDDRAHCGYCGNRYPLGLAWPRTCPACHQTTWRNPVPAVAALVQVVGPDGPGLILIRRGIEPGLGGLALPGGFLELHETWQEGVVRELCEETSIDLPAADVRLFRVVSVGDILLIFGLLPVQAPGPLLEKFTPREEASQLLVTYQNCPVVFSAHAQAMTDFFHNRHCDS